MSDRQPLPTCESCKYWKEIPESLISWDRSGLVLGWCRRYPPTVTTEKRKNLLDEPIAINSRRVVVSEDDWCGEHQPATVADTPPAGT